jgi:hypothetical protein
MTNAIAGAALLRRIPFELTSSRWVLLSKHFAAIPISGYRPAVAGAVPEASQKQGGIASRDTVLRFANTTRPFVRSVERTVRPGHRAGR